MLDQGTLLYLKISLSSCMMVNEFDCYITGVKSNLTWLFLFLCRQGGGPCIFTFTPGLHSEVTSVYARFEGLGTQKLEHTSIGWLGVFPGL